MLDKIRSVLEKNYVITRIIFYVLILILGLQQKVYFNYVAYRLIFVMAFLLMALFCNIPLEAVKKLSKDNLKRSIPIVIPLMFLIYYYVIGIGKTKLFFAKYTSITDILLLVVFFLLNLILALGTALWLVPKDVKKEKPRLISSFLVVSPSIFFIFLYVPIDTYIGNIENFEFSCKPFILYFVFLFISLSVFFALMIVKLKDKIFTILSKILVAFIICSTIQYMFMNKHLPYLDKGGDLTVNDPKVLIVNSLIWLVIFVAVFFSTKLLKEKTSKTFNVVSGLLLAFHFVSLVMLLILAPKSAFSTKVQYYFDNSEQFTLSSNENIIVIVFDGYDNSYAKEFYKAHPEKYDILKDFTMYTNTTSEFDSTATSVNQFLGNCQFNNEVSLDEFLDLGWKSERTENFYNALHDKGYKCNFYCVETPDSSKQYGKIDNVMKYDKPKELDYWQFDINKLHKDFVAVSFYRALPYVLKNPVSLLFSDETFRYYVAYVNSDKAEEVNGNYLYYMDYQYTEDKLFYYTHLRGIHQPCDTEKENEKLFKIMEKLISQLKEKDLYDNSTIIFMADHGNHKEENQFSSLGSSPLFMIKEPGKTNTEMQLSDAPICLDDFMGTIAVCAGLDNPEQYGNSIYDFDENSERTRCVYEMIYDSSKPNIYSEGHLSYMIKYNAFAKYEVKDRVEEIKGKDPFKDDIEILPMKVYFG